MQRIVLHILMSGIGAGLLSMLYFLLLAAGVVPFPVIVIVIAACLFFVFRFIERNLIKWVEDDGRKHFGTFAILAIGIITIAVKSAPLYETYGAWDAWAIWNLQAKYMYYQEHWHTMFLNTQHGHPDYPLLVPGITAFFSRLLQVRVEVVSFAFSFLITLLIPTLIFIQLRTTGIFVATYVLFMLATDKYYLSQGVSMYADTWVAFFFLCAVIAMRQQLYGNKQVILAAAALGCGIWTKNEGIVLAAVFCVFYFKELFLGGRVKYFGMGFALPFATWLLFKIAYAPQNDLLNEIKTNAATWIVDAGRYKQVLVSFKTNINTHFQYIKAGIVVYVLLCLLRRQMPGKDMYMVLSCVAAYMVVYVATAYNLEWHLNTSADRLLQQIMPTAVFVIAEHIAGKATSMPFIIRRV